MEALSPNAVKSLAFAALQGGLAVGGALLLIRRAKRLAALDKLALLWLFYSGVVHFTLVRAEGARARSELACT